ncbi:hypothetical protein B566_EDAN019046 [Ephemera danica]|nr:hypothetical protein B566_EDAN019046 [Ephemera danica]
MALISLRNVVKRYGTGPKALQVIHGVSADIADGEFVVIVGPSGCGKSTLLRMVAGLEEVSGGEISIGNRVVNEVEPAQRDIAMVFQNYALYPHMSVFDNMAYGLKIARVPVDQIKLRVDKAAKILELGSLLERKPRQLSGGQRQRVGVHWNHLLNGDQALALIVVAAVWKQISYNFLFFLAGLQSIPKSLIEAAAIDGAKPWRRFWTIQFPLLSPTTFFLFVINVVYAFFDTFAIVDAATEGGPGKDTAILVYKVYYDGFKALDLGASAAQSVVLMIIVVALTVVQFKFVEKKVTY